MSFLKLDCGILRSSLWVDRDLRDVFLTALLTALPYPADEPMPQLKIDSLEETGFVAPPGWYGFAAAAGIGLIHQAGVEREAGMCALRKLGEPDPDSRSTEYEGRRMIRVDGGFLVLNFMTYHDMDYTGAERQQRYRDRQKVNRNALRNGSNGDVTSRSNAVRRQKTDTEERGTTSATADKDGVMAVAPAEQGKTAAATAAKPQVPASENPKPTRTTTPHILPSSTLTPPPRAATPPEPLPPAQEAPAALSPIQASAWAQIRSASSSLPPGKFKPKRDLLIFLQLDEDPQVVADRWTHTVNSADEPRYVPQFTKWVEDDCWTTPCPGQDGYVEPARTGKKTGLRDADTRGTMLQRKRQEAEKAAGIAHPPTTTTFKDLISGAKS